MIEVIDVTNNYIQLKITKGDNLVPKTDLSNDDFGTLAPVSQIPFSIDDVLGAMQSMFWDIRHPVPSAWGGHIPFLFSLMTLLKPRRYVELGVHNGGSFLAACQAVHLSGLETVCVAVDNWVGEAHAGYHGAEVFSNFRKQLDAYHEFAGYIRDDFDAAALKFQEGSIDLLHIDGFHTARAVRNDFETWVKKLSPVGVVLFHDTNEFRSDFGVWRFWRKVREEYPFIEFGHSHGLGVLVVGEQSPIRVGLSGASMSLLSPVAKDFIQIICGGVGQVSWKAASSATGRPASESAQTSDYARIQYLEGVIDAMKNSTSWKITRPVRAAKSIFTMKK